jgi:hypothetical protein
MRAAARLLCALLCLVLILSGGATGGHARMVAGFTDLCRDGAAVTVAVDARGEPVDPFANALPHCPDCISPAAMIPASAPGGPSHVLRIARASAPSNAPRVRAHLRHARPLARAPPTVAV